ncbi:MAG: AI-2E family transporter [Ardenticatenales bacterium]|nr:AI-2E family transporter [Ardenticatenales bacterium]
MSSIIPQEWRATTIIQATLVVVAILFGFWLLYQVRWAIFVLLAAIVLSTALTPLAKQIERRTPLSLLASISLVYLLLGVGLALFLWLFLPLVSQQLVAIWQQLPDYYRQVRELLTGSSIYLVRQFAARLPLEFGSAASTAPAPTDGAAVPVDFAAISALFSAGFRTIFVTVATLLLSLNWTVEGDKALRFLNTTLVPPERREAARALVDEILQKVGAYVRSQAILCLFVGVLALVAYLIIGLPNALSLALFAGFMEAVPFVGPFLGAVPALLIALTLDPSKALWVAVATLIIQQVENVLLVPRIMRRVVGINPVVALLAIFSFGSLFGILGVILAIPLAAVAQILADRLLVKEISFSQIKAGERGAVTRVQYEVKEYLADIQKQALQQQDVSLDDERREIEERMERIATDLDAFLSEQHTHRQEAR